MPHIRRLGWADEHPLSGARVRFIAAAPDRIFVNGVPGTLVIEQWDARPVRGKFLLRPAGYQRRHPKNIDMTLAGPDRDVTGAQAPH
ncbi:hypothetical protein [Arthrobacter sp. OAP107]|uniref:hypothetical protein n=1 Tax=Arthrobacter sp. OAP107 TaxID=3156445 RepID=UPI0033970CF8